MWYLSQAEYQDLRAYWLDLLKVNAITPAEHIIKIAWANRNTRVIEAEGLMIDRVMKEPER